MLGFRVRIRRLGSFAAGKPAEVAQAGQALAQAQDQVAASAGRLRAARAQEESAAQAAARAEQDLDRARRTGSADDAAHADEIREDITNGVRDQIILDTLAEAPQYDEKEE